MLVVYRISGNPDTRLSTCSGWVSGPPSASNYMLGVAELVGLVWRPPLRAMCNDESMTLARALRATVHLVSRPRAAAKRSC